MIFLVKAMVITGGLLASVALVSGCGLQNITRAANKETVTYDVKDKVARVVLVGGSGDIEVDEADGGGGVKVDETLRWSSGKPVTEHKVEGDALVMSYECPHAMDNCSVNYKVKVPKGMRVEAKVGSGDIRLNALSGPTKVETGSGDVYLTELSGPITAKVGSGDLEGTGLTGTELKVQAGSGNATLKYATAPDNIDVSAGSGDAKITLPEGPYSVDAQTKTGDTTVSVKTDPSSPHRAVIRTGSGNITLLPA
ncbi:DUF4097 family beta strand repeat-containing protein [Microtetraspora malaysiensis]|uniref:DUF4097 family beta strand repeat-containing protein n=1 Tax=Microtetraspora malaysiensis TaxID=161358 RepID=UPI003D92D1B4